MPATAVSTIPVGLRAITIDNFRGIDHLELKFFDASGNPSDIIVLAGPNGSGKTAVLEACLLAVGRSELVLGTTGLAAWRGGAKEPPRITAQLHRLAQEYASEYRATDGVLRWRNETTGQGSGPGLVECLYFSSWRAPRLVGAMPITAGQRDTPPGNVEANRVWLAKQYLVNARAHDAMRLPQSAETNGTPYQAGITSLNEAWKTFYLERAGRFTVEPVSDDPSAGFDVFLIEPDGARIPVDALSSGQLELFALFGSLLRLQFGKGLVLIDEPELHLDESWHPLVLRVLRRLLPQAQLIVATHASVVQDSCSLSRVST